LRNGHHTLGVRCQNLSNLKKIYVSMCLCGDIKTYQS
jgi:hypothetical protein